MNIVLYEPEIPSNTGNIARTCAITGSVLHLIEPLGFSLEDKYLKRAGLDYWEFLNVHIYKNIDEFFEKNSEGRYFFLTTKADKYYTEVEYHDNDYLFFGPETRGLPMDLMRKDWDNAYKIPMGDKFRSLNLSNAVAIVLYEGLRQNNFLNLK